METATAKGSDVNDDHDYPLCSFCQSALAAVVVPLPSLRKKANKTKSTAIATPFCLLHYYTTSACRVGGMITETASQETANSGVTVINEKALQDQLPAQQELFAEAFVQLQQELRDVSLAQFETHKDDPLAILSDLHHSKSTKGRLGSLKAPPKKRTATAPPDGGFLRDVPIPERLQRTQQQQFRQQELLIARMNQQKMRRVDDPTQRRQPSRQSVWNIMEPRSNSTTRTKATTAAAAAAAAAVSTRNTDNDHGDDKFVLDNDVTCSSCGGHRVETLFSNASHRNQDMAKAETWGNKDRAGDVVTRYRCLQCGKTWNEEA